MVSSRRASTLVEVAWQSFIVVIACSLTCWSSAVWRWIAVRCFLIAASILWKQFCVVAWDFVIWDWVVTVSSVEISIWAALVFCRVGSSFGVGVTFGFDAVWGSKVSFGET